MKTLFYIFILIRSFSDIFTQMRMYFFSISAFLSLLVFIFCIFLILFKKSFRLEKIGKIFLIFVLFLFFQVINAYYNLDSFVGKYSFREWLRIFSIFCIFIFSYNFLNKENIQKVINIMFYSLFFTLPVGIYQLFTREEKGIYGIERIKSTFSHPEQFSYYLIFFICMCVYKISTQKSKIVWIIIMSLLIFMLIQSLTITGIVMVVFFFTLLFWRWRNKLYILLPFLTIGIVFIFSFLYFEPLRMRIKFLLSLSYPQLVEAVKNKDISNSFYFRLVNSYELITKWIDKKLLGYGLATTPFINPIKSSDGLGFEPHNEFIGFLVETGIVGLLFYLFFIFNILKTLYFKYKIAKEKEYKNLAYILISIILSWQIGSLAGHVFKGTVFQFYLWILLGCFLSQINNLNNL